jgi:hypothetical protein
VVSIALLTFVPLLALSLLVLFHLLPNFRCVPAQGLPPDDGLPLHVCLVLDYLLLSLALTHLLQSLFLLPLFLRSLCLSGLLFLNHLDLASTVCFLLRHLTLFPHSLLKVNVSTLHLPDLHLEPFPLCHPLGFNDVIFYFA